MNKAIINDKNSSEKKQNDENLNGKIIEDIYNVDRVLFIDKDNKALAIYKKYEKDQNMLKPDVMLGGI